MLDKNNLLPNADTAKEVGEALVEVGKAMGDAIREHPVKALGIGGVLGGLYLLKDRKFKLKLKRPDLDIEFEAE